MAAAENSFDITCKLDMQEVANAINQARREIETRYDLKGSKNEIVQEKQVRVAGKNRDDLQAVIALVKAKDLGIALQFTNYRST